MGNIIYEFVDLDTDENFIQLGKSFKGRLQNNTLYFNNTIVKGEIVKSEPEEGLWIRKWTLTLSEKVLLRKQANINAEEKKYSLVYFLDPSLFHLKNNVKNIFLRSHHNSVFFSSDLPMEFSVLPKQPFYCLDIAFTHSWLLKQFDDADSSFRMFLQEYLEKSCQMVSSAPCSIDEFKTLHEIEISLFDDKENTLFIRSHIYKLIVDFFSKLYNHDHANVAQSVLHYEQIMKAERMIEADIKNPPKVEDISKEVNLSVSSLLRQFKLLHGKSIQEYCVEKKMDLAKTLLLKNRITIKETAELLGYKRVSSFIETFAKQHGCSPGTLKSLHR